MCASELNEIVESEGVDESPEARCRIAWESVNEEPKPVARARKELCLC